MNYLNISDSRVEGHRHSTQSYARKAVNAENFVR